MVCRRHLTSSFASARLQPTHLSCTHVNTTVPVRSCSQQSVSWLGEPAVCESSPLGRAARGAHVWPVAA